MFVSKLSNWQLCRGALLDKDSICQVLRQSVSPTIQIVGCTDKLPSIPLITQFYQFIITMWSGMMALVNCVLASGFARGLRLIFDRYITPFLSLIWAFFSTMWPSNDPALHQPGQNNQGEQEATEIRYVRRIDTGGQRRCRCSYGHTNAWSLWNLMVTWARWPWQGCHRLGDYRQSATAVTFFRPCLRDLRRNLTISLHSLTTFEGHAPR